MSPTTGTSPDCPPHAPLDSQVGDPTTAFVKYHCPRLYRPGVSTPSPFQSPISGVPEAFGMRIVVRLVRMPKPL